MEHFNIGDTVITPYGYGAGVVIDISASSIGVRHLKYNGHMHDCRRKCEMGYGWYYIPSSLKVLKKAVPKTKQELIIEKIKYLDEKFQKRNSRIIGTSSYVITIDEMDNEEDENDNYWDEGDEVEYAENW